MSGVLHDFKCVAHGLFEARVKSGVVPRCPKGCSKSMVELVFLKPVGFVSARTRKSDKLVKEMATMQGLSDISTSPSRPGGSVMDRLRKKYGNHLHPSQLPVAGTAEHLSAMTHKTNALTDENMKNFTKEVYGQEAVMGHAYSPDEWKTDEAGKPRHVTQQHSQFLPRASVERVKRTDDSSPEPRSVKRGRR